MRYGMDDELGQVVYETENAGFLGVREAIPKGPQFSEEVAREIDRSVKRLVDHAFEKAKRILSERRDLLERAAVLLLQKETLGEDELLAITHTATSGASAEPAMQA